MNEQSLDEGQNQIDESSNVLSSHTLNRYTSAARRHTDKLIVCFVGAFIYPDQVVMLVRTVLTSGLPMMTVELCLFSWTQIDGDLFVAFLFFFF
jgi:hypothetical protein